MTFYLPRDVIFESVYTNFLYRGKLIFVRKLYSRKSFGCVMVALRSIFFLYRFNQFVKGKNSNESEKFCFTHVYSILTKGEYLIRTVHVN